VIFRPRKFSQKLLVRCQNNFAQLSSIWRGPCLFVFGKISSLWVR